MLIDMFKSSVLQKCKSMILSNKEIVALKNPKKVSDKERSILISRARNKLKIFCSEKTNKELSIIAENMDGLSLLATINIFVKALPVSFARDYFEKNGKHLREEIKILSNYNDDLKNITEEVRVIAKELNTEEFLKVEETSPLLFIKDKHSRLKEIKRIYLEDENFVLSRKLPIDKEFIKSSFVKRMIFKNAVKLKHFNLEDVISKIIEDIKESKDIQSKIGKKYGERTLKELIQVFIQLGIMQKEEASKEEFLQKTRDLLLSGNVAPMPYANLKIKPNKFSKKFQIYPYLKNKLINGEKLKVNSYYLNIKV